MSDFKAKMHQIRFRLGLRWGSLQNSPDTLAGFKGGLLLREGEGMGKEGGSGGKGRKGKRGRVQGRRGVSGSEP